MQLRSPGKRKRNSKADKTQDEGANDDVSRKADKAQSGGANNVVSPSLRRSAELQQQERQERLTLLSEDLNEPSDGLNESAAPSPERMRGSAPPPIKVFGLGGVGDGGGLSAWNGDAESADGLQSGPSHHSQQEWSDNALTEITLQHQQQLLQPLSSNLDSSITDAMASDWMGTYEQQHILCEDTLGGRGSPSGGSPLGTPTGVLPELSDFGVD